MADDDHVEYEMCEPFDIQPGELDGLAVDHIFAIAVEWHMVLLELDTGRKISRTIHAENRRRILCMCTRRGRDCEVKPTEFPEWQFLNVEAM